MSKLKGSRRKWISSAIQHPESYRRHVRRKHPSGFTEHGQIRESVIRKDESGVHGRHVMKQANLAHTLRGLNK